MNKKLDIAQNFLDSNKKIPDRLIHKLNPEESAALIRIKRFKKEVGPALNREIDDSQFNINIRKRIPEKQFHFPHLKFLIPAAAVICILIGIPVFKSIKYKNLLKEDTRNFIASITDHNAWIEVSIEDSILSSSWFSTEPIVLNDLD